MVPLIIPGVYSTTASYELLAAMIVILAILFVIIIKKTRRRLKIEEFPLGPRRPERN
ncbi:MAG: hypothetical protein HXS44_00725 [Theionarchaea archaeon]|nr:hypothetical protein [Theionarchaea archaeon]